MMRRLAGLLFVFAFPAHADFAPFTVELNDDFAVNAPPAPCSPIDITIACTEKGEEAIWDTFVDTGTTVAEDSGNLQFTSNGATGVYARAQTKVDYRNNFFVQPLLFTFTGLDFTGTPASPTQEEFLFFLSSTQAKHSATPDNLLLSIRGSGRVELSRKIDGGTVTSLFSNTLGSVPTGVTLVADETSYFLRFTNATSAITFSGAHGIAVADWGTRGDSAIGLTGRHFITPADGNTVTVLLGSFRVENLKFFDGFNNGVLADTGHQAAVWTDIGGVAEAGNVRTITDDGSSITPLSKNFNFFGQKLKFHAKITPTWAGSVAATNKQYLAVNSQAAGVTASDDSFAIVLSPDSGGRIQAGWKTNSASALPEDTNEVLNVAGTLPVAVDLILDRDAWSIVRYAANGTTTTTSGTHTMDWWDWGSGAPPMTANSAIVLENIGSTASTVSTWDRVQVQRLDPYYLTPVVYGPITDGMELEISGALDPAEHPLLDEGFLDVTAEPFSADDGGADATNALNHAVNFARENHLVTYFKCDAEFGLSNTLTSYTAVQLRSNDGAVASPSNLPFNADEQPPVLQGESNCVTRPKLILLDGSVGFDTPGTPKPLVRLWGRNYVSTGTDPFPGKVNDRNPGVTMNNLFRGIDIDLVDTITTDNDGATGLDMQAAQGSTIEEVDITCGGALRGIDGLPGSGGYIADISIDGCDHGLYGSGGSFAGAQPTPTAVGVTLSNQSVAGIRYDGRQTFVCVGCQFNMPNGVLAVDVNVASAELGKVALIDSQIEFASDVGTNTAIDTLSSIYLEDVYIRYADVAVSVPGTVNDLAGLNPTDWVHIVEYAQGIDPPTYSNADGSWDYLHTRYVNGTRTLAGADLISQIPDEAPPGDLQSRHLWGTWPAWETAAIPSGLSKNFSTDDTTDIQAALTANAVVFLPRGIHGTTAALSLADKTLIGAGRVFSQIASRLAAGSFDVPGTPEPLIQTTDDAASAAKLGFLKLRSQADNNGSYGVHWRAGVGIVRDVNYGRRSQYGFSAVPGKVSPADANYPLVKFTDNAGGKVYGFEYGESANQGIDWRHLLVDGTTLPLSFYHVDLEHAGGETAMEVIGASDVHIYGVKAETNYVVLWIRDSDNINSYGHGGLAAALLNTEQYPVGFEQRTRGLIPALYYVERTPNFRLVSLVDSPRTSGAGSPSVPGGKNPNSWHMMSEIPPGSIVQSATMVRDRPILISRVTITIPPEEAVTVAGNAVVNNGDSYIAAAGTDRAVVWVASVALGTALIDFQSATYAGQAMSVRAEGRRTTGTSGRSAALSDVLEALIPTGLGAIVGTWDVAPGTDDAWALTLDGVDQTSPVRDADIAECPSAASCTVPAMTTQEGDLAIAVCQVAPGGTSIAVSAGYTALYNGGAPLTAVMVKPITADGTETPSCTYQGTANSVMAGVVYAVSTGVGTGIVVLKRRRE